MPTTTLRRAGREHRTVVTVTSAVVLGPCSDVHRSSDQPDRTDCGLSIPAMATTATATAAQEVHVPICRVCWPVGIPWRWGR
jgi:hypothetical protein